MRGGGEGVIFDRNLKFLLGGIAKFTLCDPKMKTCLKMAVVILSLPWYIICYT